MVRYLVVCDRTLESHNLTNRMQESRANDACTFHFLVPASHPTGTWTWTEGGDRARAQSRLDNVLERLRARGLDVTGEVGDPSAVHAIAEALRPDPDAFDEILLCTPPAGLSRRVGAELAQRVERSFPLPVRHLVTSPTRPYRGHEIPEAGEYHIDRQHSSVGFTARFLTVGRVRGRFASFSGVLRIGEAPEDSSVDFAIESASIVTDDRRRDAHLRSADFLDADRHPTMTFHSTAVAPATDESWCLQGDLTIRRVTRPVVLNAEFVGVIANGSGVPRAGFTASAELDREQWGLTWNQLLETGGVLIGRNVQIVLNVQAAYAE